MGLRGQSLFFVDLFVCLFGERKYMFGTNDIGCVGEGVSWLFLGCCCWGVFSPCDMIRGY